MAYLRSSKASYLVYSFNLVSVVQKQYRYGQSGSDLADGESSHLMEVNFLRAMGSFRNL